MRKKSSSTQFSGRKHSRLLTTFSMVKYVAEIPLPFPHFLNLHLNAVLTHEFPSFERGTRKKFNFEFLSLTVPWLCADAHETGIKCCLSKFATAYVRSEIAWHKSELTVTQYSVWMNENWIFISFDFSTCHFLIFRLVESECEISFNHHQRHLFPYNSHNIFSTCRLFHIPSVSYSPPFNLIWFNFIFAHFYLLHLWDGSVHVHVEFYTVFRGWFSVNNVKLWWLWMIDW